MNTPDLKTLLEAGAHFGHRTSRWNPKMRSFIHSRQGGIHIIDLIMTQERLARAADFAANVAASGKQVLFVGTKKHISGTVKAAAERAGMPYVSERWFGGMLTNFTTMSERIKRYKKLCEELESGELEEEYNKREVGEFAEERDKLGINFAGIADMDKPPGALFVADVLSETTAIREAVRLKIPVIGIVDSNANPESIDYVIPANDDAVMAIALIANTIADAIAEAAAKAEVPAGNKTEAGSSSQPPVTSNQPKATDGSPAASNKQPADKQPVAKTQAAKAKASKTASKSTTASKKAAKKPAKSTKAAAKPEAK